MSPLRTFTSCGSSSMENFRINAPNFVRRGSFSVDQAVSFSALSRMERSLYMVNIFLFSPTRCCLNMTFPPMVSFIISMLTSITGEVSTSSTREPKISSARFSTAFPMLSRGIRRMFIIGIFPTTSIAGEEDMYLYMLGMTEIFVPVSSHASTAAASWRLSSLPSAHTTSS